MRSSPFRSRGFRNHPPPGRVRQCVHPVRWHPGQGLPRQAFARDLWEKFLFPGKGKLLQLVCAGNALPVPVLRESIRTHVRISYGTGFRVPPGQHIRSLEARPVREDERRRSCRPPCPVARVLRWRLGPRRSFPLPTGQGLENRWAKERIARRGARPGRGKARRR